MFSNKPQGVQIPMGQTQETAPVMTLVSLAEAQFYLATYGDEHGVQRREVVVSLPTVDGPAMYQTPNGEQWTESLRPFNSNLQKQFRAKLATREAQKNPNIPTKDSVDVT